jgi:uncharacterized protein (TIGR03067 family)
MTNIKHACFLRFSLKTMLIGVFVAACAAKLLTLSLERSEMRRLVGEWSLVSLVVDGEPWDTSVIDRIIFDGETVFVHNGPETFRYRVRIAPLIRPDQLDIVSLDWSDDTPSVGIYKHSNDLLTVCIGTELPTTFSAPKDSHRSLIKLKRIK